MRSMGRGKRKVSNNIDKKNAKSNSINAIEAVLITAVFILPAAMATEYTVGDATGWDFAPSSSYYSDWATGLKFLPGDKLVFKYLPSAHNVQEVTEADYTACNGVNPIAEYETGNDIVTLGPKPGQHFFICGFLGHCEQGGMKFKATILSSVVTNASSPSSPPTTPSPSPTKPAPQLPSPMTSVVPQLPGGDSPAPPAHGSHGHGHGALPPASAPISTPGGHSRAAPSPVPVRLTLTLLLLLLLPFVASLFSWSAF